MEKISNQKKGITLIALVITVIVLLILAGISISMITGENGILQKATEAKTQTGIGQEKETIALAYNSALAKKVSNGDSSAVTDNELNDELDSNEANASGSPIIVTFTKSGNVYKIQDDGTIILSSNEEIATTEINITEFSINPTGTQVTTPPIPNGFYYVGGTLHSGYVISDNASDENKYASSTDVGVDLQGNQFVWVPVAQNQIIKIKVTSSDPITSIILTNPAGEEKTIGNESGIEYEVDPASFTKVYNGMYSLKATAENGQTVSRTLIVRTLYAMDAYNDYYVDYYASDECINQFVDEWRF